jgi:Protein of unknown function (DUF2934)
MNRRPARQTKVRTPQATSRPQDKIVAAAATDTNQSPVSAPADLHSLVAKRAYEIHAERGFRSGCALDDWLEAEGGILNRSHGQ